MRYLTRFALIISALVVFYGAAAVTEANAQSVIYRRPVLVHRYYNPFYRGTLWDPYWYRYNDPFYWRMREEYYDRKAVTDAQKKIAKDRQKFARDGYIDAKEAEKLAKDQQKYNKAVRELNDND